MSIVINPIDLEVLKSNISGDLNSWGQKEQIRDKATQDKINEIIEVVNETNNFGKMDKGGYEGTGQDLKDEIDLKEDKSNKGVANGYASLNPSGKVPLSQMDDSLVGAVEYKGVWDASTNNPTLTVTPTEKGIYYIVSVKGTQFGLDFEVGDWIISNGTSWGRLDNSLTPEEIQNLTFSDLTTTNKGLISSINEHESDLIELNRKAKVYTFDTMTQAQSASWLFAGDIVEVLGYYVKGDGGGHKRIVSATDDGSGQSVGSLWANLIKTENYISPKIFGAKGDGITDDTFAINRIINFTEWIDGEHLIYCYNGQLPAVKRFRNIYFKQISTIVIDKFFDITNMYGREIRNFGLYCDNKCKIGIYSNGGQNGNIMDNILVEKATEYNFKIEGAWLGSYSNIQSHKCVNGIGVYIKDGHNAVVNRIESKWNKIALQLYSGASLIINTLDTSYTTETDIKVLFMQAPININGWYTETSYGNLLELDDNYTTNLTINGAMLDNFNGTGFLKVVGTTGNNPKYLRLKNFFLKNSIKVFDIPNGFLQIDFEGEYENCVYGDLSKIRRYYENGTYYNRGISIIDGRGYGRDIGDIRFREEEIQHYTNHFTTKNQQARFTDTQAINRTIKIKVYLDSGFSEAFVNNGVVTQNKTAGMRLNVQTNGGYLQVIYNEYSEGVTVKAIIEVSSYPSIT